MQGEEKAITRPATAAIAGFLAAIVAMMLALTLGASQAWAGAQPSSPRIEDLTHKTYTVSLKDQAQYPDSGYRQYQSVKSPNKKIAGVKSSKTSVATAKVNCFEIPDSGQKTYVLAVNIKKKGTTTISFKFGGKAYKVKYVVKSYTNPLKSLKVGSKNYASKLNPKALSTGSDSAFAPSLKKPFTGKVNIKLKSGWKIKKCWYYADNELTYFKNGQKVPKWQTLYIWVKKGSQYETLYFNAFGNLTVGSSR